MPSPIDTALRTAVHKAKVSQVVGDGAVYDVTPVPGKQNNAHPSLFIRADPSGHPEAFVRIERGQARESHVSDAIRIRGIRLRADGKGQLTQGEHHFLRITCIQPHLVEAFKTFLNEISRRLEAGGRAPFDVVRITVYHWRALLAVAGKKHDTSKLAGLFGELAVLKNLVSRQGANGIALWKGPDGAAQDFRSDRVALEVKTSLNVSSDAVTIHGLGQLDAPAGADMYIILLLIEESADGETVDELIAKLREEGVDSETLDQKLLNVDYVSGNAHNNAAKFVLTSSSMWNVPQDAPGLRRSQLSHNHIRGLVGDVSYKFSLGSLGRPLSGAIAEEILNDCAPPSAMHRGD